MEKEELGKAVDSMETGIGDEYDDFLDDIDDGVDIADLPPAKYTGPVDFKFVKDPAKRDELLAARASVGIVLHRFAKDKLMQAMTADDWGAAAKRMDFTPEDILEGGLARNVFCRDFTVLLEDRNGGPVIRRVMKDPDSLSERDRAAAAYYENYRFTWLEVLAAKAGIGMKCRDLLNGEDLFLAELGYSRGDVKGSTICVGIAPMGAVYFSYSTLIRARFTEGRDAALQSILAKLGLPEKTPGNLSFPDQARFAAETFRLLADSRDSDLIHYY
ncbi:MAG: hypothetical protein K6G91_14300 [Kiritimatiellae bacterium]|nr:hypothetical protein [Kiritimatiellia bacterium]